MKRVLITGAAGFIGRHCLPRLVEDGYEVHAVSSADRARDPSTVHWHLADLLDRRQVAGVMAEVRPTHLLHLAWYTVPGRYWTALENFHWVGASLDLIETFVEHGGRRLVSAGTCAEYDWSYGYCVEGMTPLAPATPYGVCKDALRAMVESFASQTGLSSVWGRVFFLYGPHEHPGRLVPSVIRSLLHAEPARCTHGNQIRDFLYVQDVADAFVMLLGSDTTGAVNIASGQPIRLRDIIIEIADQLGELGLVRLGALPPAPGEPSVLLGDASRLRQEVGWSPSYCLADGLEQTIAWWKERRDWKVQ